MCDEEFLSLSKGIKHWQDTDFVGHNLDGIQIYITKKKLKGKELTPDEKQEHGGISRIIIKVEHATGGVKKCRIVKERFR